MTMAARSLEGYERALERVPAAGGRAGRWWEGLGVALEAAERADVAAPKPAGGVAEAPLPLAAMAAMPPAASVAYAEPVPRDGQQGVVV